MSHVLFSKETIILDMDVSNREDVIHRISGHLFLLKRTNNPAGLYKDVMAREAIVSTFASMETAIPHTFSKNISKATLFFVRIQADDLTWSNKHENVKLVFFLVVPEVDDLKEQRTFLSRVFSQIARIISDRDSIEFLKNVSNHEDAAHYLTTQLDINI